MLSKFSIWQATTESLNDRPPISHKVRDYLIEFITDEVLKKKKIILNAKWDVILTIYFVGEGKFSPHSIVVGKGSRTVSSENKKIFEVLIPIQLIKEGDKKLNTIQLMFAAVSLFLTSTYKTITAEFIDNVRKKIDMNYLMSLTYPASTEEQNYVEHQFS